MKREGRYQHTLFNATKVKDPEVTIPRVSLGQQRVGDIEEERIQFEKTGEWVRQGVRTGAKDMLRRVRDATSRC
jgi:hypothetical protein